MIRAGYSLIFIAFLIACDTPSNILQPNKGYFLKYFGGDGNQTAVDLIVNTDGTFFILGNSQKPDSAKQIQEQRIYLAKANALGELMWEKTYGDTTVKMEARNFLLTADGKYLAVVANRYSSSSNSTVSLLLIDINNGALGPNVNIPVASSYSNSITQLKDQGFIISGVVADTIAWVYRVNNSLNKVWQFTLGAGSFNVATKTYESNTAGNFYVFGSTNAKYQQFTTKRFWAFKLGTNGGILNNSDTLKGFSSSLSNDIITNVTRSVNGDLLTGISTDAANNALTVRALKITSVELKFISLNDYGGIYSSVSLGVPTTNTTPKFATACPTTSGGRPGFLILTNTYLTSLGSSAPSDIALMKVDESLNNVWGQSPVQFGGDGEDIAAAVAELSDGHIMILGTMQLGNPPEQNKIVLMKLNAQGQLAQ